MPHIFPAEAICPPEVVGPVMFILFRKLEALGLNFWFRELFPVS